ncbi:DUF1617 family protein (plasmid) [Latilactobacillus curvatus]|uniref:DUF1617 family protein n=1 Tax=Latilactobacillus curvatus TaxID=28038 RepID=UPI0024BA794D|nr:DUF1617 family protein [Latilactobacillus curvatus]WHQ77612.1 DUF1617 family protein [Latilactobacillus curvatus]WHQ78875.1 DUF1617 family protein [Latilactobacillus curvatus]WHQ79293.1 DUF1617 family protein [Latilactobacillus curvatus]
MTKTLEFKNKDMVAVGNFLGTLNLKSKASRGRSKLVKLLMVKIGEYNDDRKEALDPYFKDGELLKDKDGKNLPENEEKAKKIVEEMESETAVIEFTEYSEKLKALYEAIVDYPGEFNGVDGMAYDLLMDQLESAFENEMEETK